jgi:hypothetical protein
MGELASGSGDKRHTLKVRKDDLYETPPEAILALLKAETIPDVLWDPSCGPGAIARVLRAAGRQVYATDLVNYESPDQNHAGWDFLSERKLPLGVQGIIQNPPYKLANEFVRHSLQLCHKSYFLLRLAFLESIGRSDILDGGLLARVLVFKNRLPMLHRDGWSGPKSTNTMCFAWFVFDAAHKGPTELHRISWERNP